MLLSAIKLKYDGKPEKYSPASIYMKMRNYSSRNPDDPNKGLDRISKLDQGLYEEFKNNRKRLSNALNMIISAASNDELIGSNKELEKIGLEVQEGQRRLQMHYYRERKQDIARKKKEEVFKETGCLKCECCNFDFKQFYGNHGDGFIECHHNIPISQIKDGEVTKLKDLSLICANCHRMIHYKLPWLSISDLIKNIKSNSGNSNKS